MSSFLCTTLSSILSPQEFIENLLHHRSDAADIFNPDVLLAIIAGFLIIAGSIYIFLQKKIQKQNERSDNLWIFSCIFVFISVVVVASLVNRSVTYDESFSLAMIKHSVKEIVSLSCIKDVHPPLYYFILKGAISWFGNHFIYLKLVSILPAIVTLCLTTCFLYKNISRGSAKVFPLCFLASDSLFHFSIELRMYSLACCFVTLLALTCWYIIKTGKKKWWVAFVFCAVGAAYSHLYGAFAAGLMASMLFFYIIFYRKPLITRFAVSVLISVLLFSPQLIISFRQFTDVAEGNFLITDSTSLSAWKSYASVLFSSGNPYLLFLTMATFLAIAVFAVSKKSKTHNDKFALACLTCFALLFGISLLISVIIRPMLIYRFLVPVAPLIWIFFAIETDTLRNLKLIKCIVYSLSVLCVVSCTTRLIRERNEGNKFRSFQTHIRENVGDKDIFLYSKNMKTGQADMEISGILSSMFNRHIHITSEKIDYGRGNNAIFMNELFEQIFTDYSDYEQNSEWHQFPVWIFTSIYEDFDQFNDLPVDKTQARFSGQFGWNASHQYKIYRIDSQAQPDDETNQ